MNHDEIRAALAAATPGPWAWLYPDQCCRDGYCIKSKADLDTCDGVTHAMKALHADVVLIANAPTWLAELLAEVDRLTSRALPDPKGGCVCRSHSEDRGGGYFELMVEYEPACPEHYGLLGGLSAGGGGELPHAGPRVVDVLRIQRTPATSTPPQPMETRPRPVEPLDLVAALRSVEAARRRREARESDS